MKLSEELKQSLSTEIIFTATKSSGPGGQNVNKVSSRVELRFSIQQSKYLEEHEKQRIRGKLKNRINSEDELILVSQTERTQLGNKEMVTALFFRLIEKALTIPRKRIKTIPTKASQEKRLETKKKTGLKKQFRKPPEV